MKQRQLGHRPVSALGLGCMGLSQAYGHQDEADSVRTLQRAVSLGVTFLDTAEIYGPLLDEALLGRALKPSRDTLVLPTNFSITLPPTQP